MLRRWFCVVVATGLGCQAAPPGGPLPRYSNLDGNAVQIVLAQRAKMIHTMTGRCELTLTRPDHQSIRLDGLMVMAPPDRVRLRVWKLDQAVFDLTALPDGVWTETAPGGPNFPATVSAGQMARQMSWLIGGFFAAPGLQRQTSPDGELIFCRDAGEGTSIVCEVDAATATARRFTLRDSVGKTRFSLQMSDYRQVQGIAWPIHIAAKDADDMSEMGVAFNDVEFNAELAPRAFIPPPGAKKLP